MTRQEKKRSDYLGWQEYFMSIAFLSAQRSKDPNTQVGACIVDKENKVVGIGYNGMPVGCSDDIMPWNRAEYDTKEKWLESKSPFVCHAELNAVLNKNQSSVKDCSIYVALFPCNMCAQIIIQSGISEVVYYSDKYHTKPEFKASRFLLDTAGVKYRQFRPRQKKIVIEFQLIEGIQGLAPTLPAVECDNSEREDSIDNKVNSYSNGYLTINNNNSGIKKSASFENHAEQQQLQNVNDLHLAFPPQLPQQNQVQSNDGFEFNFAIFSFLLMIIFALFSWYLSFLIV